MLGEVTAKVDSCAGNPFGAAYVSVDDEDISFADVGPVDKTPDVDTSQGDGAIDRRPDGEARGAAC